MLYDGWVLRFADGYTKRANSVNPIHDSTLDVDDKIQACEQLYTANRLPTVFKITPYAHPADLDRTLEQLNYALVDTTSVQTLNLANVREPDLRAVTIEEELSSSWLDNFCRLNHVQDRDKSTMTRMLANIRTKHAFISLQLDGQVIACGLGVIERDYIGLYDIVTDAGCRCRGYGEQLILNLLHWGRANGATHSYLAVVLNNAPALRLYAKIGYGEVYRYWYRVKELPHM